MTFKRRSLSWAAQLAMGLWLDGFFRPVVRTLERIHRAVDALGFIGAR